MFATRLNWWYRLTGTKLSRLYFDVTSSLPAKAPGGRRLRSRVSNTHTQQQRRSAAQLSETAFLAMKRLARLAVSLWQPPQLGHSTTAVNVTTALSGNPQTDDCHARCTQPWGHPPPDTCCLEETLPAGQHALATQCLHLHRTRVLILCHVLVASMHALNCRRSATSPATLCCGCPYCCRGRCCCAAAAGEHECRIRTRWCVYGMFCRFISYPEPFSIP
jgi:hypothetical protein